MKQRTIDGGLLIVFEGIDGVGKTTQLELAYKKLEEKGYKVSKLRNLGTTAIGEALRTALKSPVPRPALTNLYVGKAVQQALIEELDQKRSEGSIVLLDRSPLSLVAYSCYGDGADRDLGWQLTEEDMTRYKPDLIMLYDGDITTSLERAKQISGNSDYYDSKSLDYFERVDKGLKEGAERYHAEVIDARGSIEEVSQKTTALIDQLLKA